MSDYEIEQTIKRSEGQDVSYWEMVGQQMDEIHEEEQELSIDTEFKDLTTFDKTIAILMLISELVIIFILLGGIGR